MVGTSGKETYLIIGGGVVGGRAAETLRTAGFDGRVRLISAESNLPYRRPPLSKEYLRGERDAQSLFLRPLDFYERRGIELLEDRRVNRVDVVAKYACLENGEEVPYDKALIATGATPRRLTVPGSELAGVVVLRTIEESTWLRTRFEERPRVLVVGSGFIGCEVAASARALGCEVTMVSPTLPMLRALGEPFAEFYASVHRERGVDVQTGVGIVRFRGGDRVEAAITSAGKTVACDVAVAGVGVVPETALLAGEPVTLENGVATDEFCRTSADGLFAAGDVANWWHPELRRRIRIEHFDNAKQQGVAAAKNMLDANEPYAPIPYFWSDQYDLNLQYVGFAGSDDRFVMRGDPESRSFSGFFLADGRLTACIAVNRARDLAAARKLLQSGRLVSFEQLADDSFDLKQLSATE
jgi:3-phenylpropionate/trans-cinnamate dioxygenase ferredoxin reductase component